MPGVDQLLTAFSGSNAAFIADLYAKWVANPGQVDPSFGDLFQSLNDESRSILTDASGASWSPRRYDFGEPEAAKLPPAKGAKGAAPGMDTAAVRAAIVDSIRALMLIRVYRVRGHLEARLDPLGLQKPKTHPELDYHSHGFTDADLDRPIFIDRVLGRDTATLREIIGILRSTYCGPLGVEFMHIQDPDQKAWIQRKVENAPWGALSNTDEKREILTQLTEAEGFEAFCQKKFVGTKRFGLEGGEITIPAMHAVIGVAAEAGVTEIAIGMPHRGRLNTLVNIVKKPFTQVFSEFGGASSKPEDVQGSGDV